MRHGFFILLALVSATVAPTAVRAQQPAFGGMIIGDLVSADPTKDGSAAFFSAAASFSTASQPFLIGQVSFNAGGESKAFVFTAGLEVAAADGTPMMAFFSTPVPVRDASSGTQTSEALVLRGQPSDTATLDGKTYTLELAGVTQGNTYTDPQDTLVSTKNSDQQATANLWATVTEVQTVGDTDPHHCHDTPEPATWLLAALAVVGGLACHLKRRGMIASV